MHNNISNGERSGQSPFAKMPSALAELPPAETVSDGGPAANGQIDYREQLFNQGDVGKVERVSRAVEEIVFLHGIMLDIDPKIFTSDYYPAEAGNVSAFFSTVIAPMIDRHSVLRNMEVRRSGTGLHGLIWFGEPLEFHHESNRARWSMIVKAVQRLLPTDPCCPGITALTRPLGSINSKNQSVVTQIQAGKPVATADIEASIQKLTKAPFRELANVLFGEAVTQQCPVCRRPGSRLGAFDRFGKCYGSCGRVQLHQLYDVYIGGQKPHTQSGEVGVTDAQ